MQAESMKRYIEPTLRARQLFFLGLLVVAGVALLADRANQFLPPLSSDEVVALDQMVERSLLAALLASVFWCGLGGAAIYLTNRAIRSRQWPPAGISVPFRTEAVDIKRPWVAWALLVVFLVTCVVQIAGPWYGYATLRELAPTLKRVLAKQPSSPQPTRDGTAPSSIERER